MVSAVLGLTSLRPRSILMTPVCRCSREPFTTILGIGANRCSVICCVGYVGISPVLSKYPHDHLIPFLVANESGVHSGDLCWVWHHSVSAASSRPPHSHSTRSRRVLLPFRSAVRTSHLFTSNEATVISTHPEYAAPQVP